MCSGTFNNPSMKLLVIRDAIPDTPDLITHPPCCCLVSYSRSPYPFLYIFFPPSLPPLLHHLLYAIYAPVCIFFCIKYLLFAGSLFLLVIVSPRFHALFISTVIVDNVIKSENNIDVVASVYCDTVTMYLCRFDGVTIVEIGVIVNAMIKTIMATIAEIVWHCCASLIRICVALSKRVAQFTLYISDATSVHQCQI